ncbi:hypothetical protein [Aliikangiella maris]|uniref:Uncharacterized protein n=2 Tax=Aliikangiella maris TaxID=3162458 RepID=A0ABV3MUF7_9GAMM
MKLTVNDGHDNSTPLIQTVEVYPIMGKQLFTFNNLSNSEQTNIPFTFASVFKKGGVLQEQSLSLKLANEQIIPLQTNIKALHNDNHSIHHAIFSGFFPKMSALETINAEIVASTQSSQPEVQYNKGNLSSNPNFPIDLASLIDSHWNLTIDITLQDVTYHVNAKTLLLNQPSTHWLQGEVVNEWIVAGHFVNPNNEIHPHLLAQLAIRVYGNLDHIRTSFTIENGSAYTASPKNLTYDISVKQNNDIIYSQNALNHLRNTR